MRPQFSEFSYGFALSREMMNLPDFTGTPLLPSTREEGKLGFDLKIPKSGYPMFLQFKLADYLKRPNSKYIKDGSYDEPYYRVAVYNRNRSRQHNILWDLAHKGEQVFYAAPAFHTQNDFDKNFTSNGIYKGSAFFNLCDLPKLEDNLDHDIVFPEGKTSSYRWRSNKSIEYKIDFSGPCWYSRMLEMIKKKDNQLGEEYILKLYDITLQLLKNDNNPDTVDFVNRLSSKRNLDHIKFGDKFDNFYPIHPIIEDLRTLLFVYFGVEPIVLNFK